MIFWRSNSKPIALSFCVVFSVIVAQVAWTEEASDTSTDWPEEIDFAPTTGAPKYFQKTDNPIIQRYNATDPGSPNNIPTVARAASQSNNSKKRSWNPFKKLFGPKPPPPLTEEQITKVGPRDYPAAPDPLLALPVPIVLGATNLESSNTTIPAGFYLVKQANSSNTGDSRQLTLLRENRVVGQLTLTLAFENNNSPLSQEVKKSPVPATPVLSTVLSPKVADETQTLVIVLKEGEKRFESQPIPVSINPRHEYRY